MADTKAEFGAHERRRNRGVDVTVDENQVWLAFQNHRLKANHDLGSLLSMTARTNCEVNIRSRDAELLKEDVGHFDVVVLAGVD